MIFLFFAVVTVAAPKPLLADALLPLDFFLAQSSSSDTSDDDDGDDLLLVGVVVGLALVIVLLGHDFVSRRTVKPVVKETRDNDNKKTNLRRENIMVDLVL